MGSIGNPRDLVQDLEAAYGINSAENVNFKNVFETFKEQLSQHLGDWKLVKSSPSANVDEEMTYFVHDTNSKAPINVEDKNDLLSIMKKFRPFTVFLRLMENCRKDKFSFQNASGLVELLFKQSNVLPAKTGKNTDLTVVPLELMFLAPYKAHQSKVQLYSIYCQLEQSEDAGKTRTHLRIMRTDQVFDNLEDTLLGIVDIFQTEWLKRGIPESTINLITFGEIMSEGMRDEYSTNGEVEVFDADGQKVTERVVLLDEYTLKQDKNSTNTSNFHVFKVHKEDKEGVDMFSTMYQYNGRLNPEVRATVNPTMLRLPLPNYFYNSPLYRRDFVSAADLMNNILEMKAFFCIFMLTAEDDVRYPRDRMTVCFAMDMINQITLKLTNYSSGIPLIPALNKVFQRATFSTAEGYLQQMASIYNLDLITSTMLANSSLLLSTLQSVSYNFGGLDYKVILQYMKNFPEGMHNSFFISNAQQCNEYLLYLFQVLEEKPSTSISVSVMRKQEQPGKKIPVAQVARFRFLTTEEMYKTIDENKDRLQMEDTVITVNRIQLIGNWTVDLSKLSTNDMEAAIEEAVLMDRISILAGLVSDDQNLPLVNFPTVKSLAEAICQYSSVNEQPLRPVSQSQLLRIFGDSA